MEAHERYKRLLKKTFIDYNQTAKIIEKPLIFPKAEGLYQWDLEGKKYFDAIGGIFVAVLGHRHPRVVEAVKKQLDKTTFSPSLHGVSDVGLELVDKLGSISPGDLNFVKGFCGGSESIEAAMKLSRQYFKQTGRGSKYKFISNYLSYHGGTFAAMAASGNANRKINFEPQMGGFIKMLSPMQLRDKFASWAQTCAFTAQMFEDVIINENPDTVAGIVIEPICNTGGIITPTQEYFQIIRDLCDKYDVMLIFDEVLTGFGKTGAMFAADAYQVVPDIICSGKSLTSGVVPGGAIMAHEHYADAFYGDLGREFAHGHSYANNPMTSAAGIAVIDVLTEEKLPEKAERLGAYLENKLNGLNSLGIIKEIRGKGVLRGVELVSDQLTGKKAKEGLKLGNVLKQTAIDNGLIMRIDPDWFAVCPPLIANEPDIDELVSLIEKSLKDALSILSE